MLADRRLGNKIDIGPIPNTFHLPPFLQQWGFNFLSTIGGGIKVVEELEGGCGAIQLCFFELMQGAVDGPTWEAWGWRHGLGFLS
jgi:hypothetical protein